MELSWKIRIVWLFLAAFGSNVEVLSKDFLLGGQIPFWLEKGEPSTSSYGADADRARALISERADEMFDIVIPSGFSWDWVEARRGRLDMHRYEWAHRWGQRYGKPIFGQHLFWGWSDSMPSWARNLGDDALRVSIFKHIEDMHSQIGDIPRLTVINEMLCKPYLADRLGEGIVHEIFAYTKEIFPRTELFLNEHGCPNQYQLNDHTIRSTLGGYADFVNRLESSGVRFDRVGFQSYFHKSDVLALGGIARFVEQYSLAVNEFAQETGRKLFITELGFASPDEEFKAEFLRAFYLMIRENQNIEGLIVFHWLDDQEMGSALVNRDGSLTKGGEVFYDVFGR